MKNGEILNLYEALTQLTEQKFNVKVSYLFAKNKQVLKSDAQLIYETRQKILLEYGTVEENGDIIIPREKIDEVNQKINELMEVETSVGIDKMPLDWLDNYELSIDCIEALMPMLYEQTPITQIDIPILID